MKNTEEEWRPIPGVDRYEASSWGRVRHCLRKIPIEGRYDRKGYPIFSYRDVENKSQKHYKNRNMFIHQAVALAFHGLPEDQSFVVMHLDNDKTNNRPENLRWGSRAENNAQAVQDGLHWPSAKTHCKKGHPLSGDNLLYIEKRNRRVCRTCKRKSSQKSYWSGKNAEPREPFPCGYPRAYDGQPCEKIILPGRTSCGFHPAPEGLGD